MAWNGSSLSGRESANRSGKAGRARFRRNAVCIVGLIAAITGLLLVAWLIVERGDGQLPDGSRTANHAIEEKTPSLNASREKRKASRISDRKPDGTQRIERPELNDDNPIVRQKALGRVVKWEHRDGPPLFTNRFESLVCEIMTAEPGERFLELDIGEDFDDIFKESLGNRISISANDSDDVKFMKQTVIDAKEQVRQLVLQGKSARDVIIEARDELNKIADYRDELQNAVDEYLVTATDPREALKLVQEANDILAEYGAMPVDGPDDVETAYELMINAKEEKLQEIDAASAAEEQME